MMKISSPSDVAKLDTLKPKYNSSTSQLTRSFDVIYSKPGIFCQSSCLSFRDFFWDEIFCERKRGITFSPRYSTPIAKEVEVVSYERIPKNTIRDLFNVPLRLEKMLILGFFVCLECFLYELTIMPLQAFFALCNLLRIFLRWMVRSSPCKVFWRTFHEWKISLTTKLQQCFASQHGFIIMWKIRKGYAKSQTFYIAKMFHLNFFSESYYLSRSFNVCSTPTASLSPPQACDMMRTVILVCGVYLFNRLFDVSEIYHFIRAQSLMKLYVIFNMLEIFERLWRSLGRDALDSLMRQVVSLFEVDYQNPMIKTKVVHDEARQPLSHYVSPGGKGTKISIAGPSHKQVQSYTSSRINRTNVVQLFTSHSDNDFFGKTSRFHNIMLKASQLRNSSAVYQYQHYWFLCLRLFLSIILVSVYVVVHSLIHLLRALLLNISLNSSDSVIFLIVTSNNFAELKSTVFKKYSKVTLFSVVASDAVERFYLFLDGIIVFLRLTTSVRTPMTSFFSVITWLAGMIFLECIVDWVKHFFLLKLNFLPTKLLVLYREVAYCLQQSFPEALWADILVSRQKSLENSEKNLATQWKTPCKSYYSFPHICSRRLGFVALPLTSQLISFLLQFPWKEHFFIVSLTVTLLWSCLLMVKLIVSIALISLGATKQNYLSVHRDPELQNLSAI